MYLIYRNSIIAFCEPKIYFNTIFRFETEHLTLSYSYTTPNHSLYF